MYLTVKILESPRTEKEYILWLSEMILHPKNLNFQRQTDDTKMLKDIIEEKPVPAKYYLSDVYVETLRRHKARHEAKGNGFGYEFVNGTDCRCY